MSTSPTVPWGHARVRQIFSGASAVLPARIAVCAVAVTFAIGIYAESPATVAAAAGGGWTVSVLSTPTNFAPGGGGGLDSYVLTVTNTSGRPSDGSTITVIDRLPSGIASNGLPFGIEALSEGLNASGELSCPPTSQPQCSYTGVVPAGDSLTMTVPVNVAAVMPPTVTNMVEVSGGGVAAATAHQETTISSTSAGFGVPAGGFQIATSNSQAGAHPDITTVTSLTSAIHRGDNALEVLPLENLKDIDVALPPGLIADPAAVPQCSPAELIGTGGFNWGGCPPDTQVGLATVYFIGTQGFKTVPVYNMTTEPGQPARFGFYAILAPVFIVPHVRSDGDYGATASLTNIAEALPILSSVLTLWGVPGDASHNSARMAGITPFFEPQFGAPSGIPSVAFTSNPSACGGPLGASMSLDGWQAIGAFALAGDALPAGSGCASLAFEPSISAAPDLPTAGAPTAYSVELHLPQNQDPAGLSTSTLRDATVALPPGTVISPSAADGLQACSDAPASPAGDQFGVHSLTPASCPPASQVGTVEVHSPLLSSPLQGQVFLGQPNCAASGCTPADAQDGNMIRLFLQVQGSGVIVKLEGHGSVDQSSGRLMTSFQDDPQLPFEDLKLTLKGGPRAPLANPTSCGAAETTSDMTPWSSPFTPDATPSSRFEVTGCSTPQFSPGFSAGTTSNRAGAFSPFTTTITRTDRDQPLGGVSVSTPTGLLGVLKSVSQCPEPQASVGACPVSSQIGHAIVGAGPGAQPLYLPQAGRREDPVFLTGPYRGAPFGLAILDHAEAGPFNLGDIVVRAAIEVDPHTARITIASDPLPSIRDGVPLALRTIDVIVDRGGFIFNPTSCAPLSVEGALTSTQGTGAAVASRFQAADCAALKFHPSFKVSTGGAASNKGNGASLGVNVGAHEGPQSNPAAIGEANLKRVNVQLPKALPARLTTLQQACTAAQFAANPSGCPKGSFVGTAVAHTPILQSALSGPAILVSHGGAAFPDLVLVLQGEGIVLDLTGNTFIKHGITLSKFETVPDAPISSFALSLPRGGHSALASTIGNLCGRSLTMPTTMEGQNGAVLEQNTKITVSGCKPKRHHKSRRAKKH